MVNHPDFTCDSARFKM